MRASPFSLAALGALAWVSACAPRAGAEQVRFRFAPADAAGNLTQVAAGPGGALGERLRGLAMTPEPYPYAVRPNQMVSFRHPFTGGNVVVPLRLPEDTPRIERRAESVVFNYGSYAVAVYFHPDGSVTTVYNSGYLRPLRFD